MVQYSKFSYIFIFSLYSPRSHVALIRIRRYFRPQLIPVDSVII